MGKVKHKEDMIIELGNYTCECILLILETCMLSVTEKETIEGRANQGVAQSIYKGMKHMYNTTKY